MARGLTANMQAALARESVWPLWFVYLGLDMPSYTWTGVGQTSQLGSVWSGVGEHGVVSGIQSSRELRAHSISLALVGIPSAQVPLSVMQTTRNQRYQGRTVNVYMSVADLGTGIPLLAPELIWTGRADVATFQYGKTISVAITADHMTSHLSRPNGLRGTTENHNQRLGNPATMDLFFDGQSRLAGRPRPLLSG